MGQSSNTVSSGRQYGPGRNVQRKGLSVKQSGMSNDAPAATNSFLSRTNLYHTFFYPACKANWKNKDRLTKRSQKNHAFERWYPHFIPYILIFIFTEAPCHPYEELHMKRYANQTFA